MENEQYKEINAMLLLLSLTCLPAAAPPVADPPVIEVAVDLADEGPLQLWRHSIGHGGINPLPLPDRVVKGTAKLKPRLIRIFIQEFFQIYPEHGRFDWSRLDPYMDALARTGAKVVAAITIKPKPLFPKVDQAIWRPNDVAQWQRVIAALVRCYSVDRRIVTYWEIGNETDISEHGGCPYLIRNAGDYATYYRLLKRTLLVVLGEFGRTPRINKAAGRDHWHHCYSVLLTGGGVRSGLVLGQSDRNGAYPIQGRVCTPADLCATVYHCFGIDPKREVRDSGGRPLPLSRGEIIRELF
jgi:hypothetical protein